MTMWCDGIMTNRSTHVPAFGIVAAVAQETDSTVKRNARKSAFKNEQTMTLFQVQQYGKELSRKKEVEE